MKLEKTYEGFLKKTKNITKEYYRNIYGKNFFTLIEKDFNDDTYQLIIELHSYNGLLETECFKFLNFLEKIFKQSVISDNNKDFKKYKKFDSLDTRVFKITLNKETFVYIYYLYNKFKEIYQYSIDHKENHYYYSKYYDGDLQYYTSNGNLRTNTINTIDDLIDSYSHVLLEDIDDENILNEYLIKEIEENNDIINDNIFKTIIEDNNIIKSKFDYLFNAKKFDLL